VSTTTAILAFFEQDRARWDAKLVADGLALFEASASGRDLSRSRWTSRRSSRRGAVKR
jgi:hypothetical protein